MPYSTINDFEYSENDVQRFWIKVGPTDPVTGCRNWQAAVFPYGYGLFRLNHKNWLAHRVAWILTNGAIPNDRIVCHKCDNPPCCNPDHLFLGTFSDNSRDRDQKGRRTILIGEKHGRAKLTDSEAEEIKKSSKTQYELARQYNVSQSLVSLIRRGERRKHK